MDPFKISNLRVKELVLLFLIFLVALPGIFPLIKPGFFPTQDGDNLLIRFADFHRAILDHHLPPRWAGNLNYTYGYPVLIFLYPGLLYLWEAIHVLGFSLLTSVKVSLMLSVIFSGVFMYQFVKELFGKLPALVSAIFYIYFPYRFVNLYRRGSFGEAVGLMFVPLIFWLILKMAKETKAKYLVLISLSLAALITVHNVQALIFFPFILLFMGVLLIITRQKKEKLFLSFLLSLFLTLGLACFFWLPAFLERGFTIFDKVLVSEFFKNFLDLRYLFFFHQEADKLPLQIGLFPFLVGISSLFLWLFLKKRQQKLITLFFSLTFILSFLFMTDFSKIFWQVIRIDKFFQFPWRFLSLTGFTTSILSALPIFLLRKKWPVILALFLGIGTFLNCLPYIKPIGFLPRDDNFYLTNDATTTSSNEYLPIWVKKPPTRAPEEKIETEAEVTIQEYKTHKRSFLVKTSEPAQVQINTVYFPGWQVKVDGQPVGIDYQNNGLLVFEVPAGEHQVLAKFGETTVRKIADVITLASLVFAGFLFLRRRNEKFFD